MITAILSLVVLSAIAWLLYLDLKRPHNFPPGPLGWPIIGSTSYLRKLSRKHGGQYLALEHLAAEMGSAVLGLKLGRDWVAVAVAPATVKEVFARGDFAGRPDSFFMRLRCFGAKQGITFADGELWHEQRSFTLRTLKDLGMGKQKMENLILDQVRQLIQQFSQGEDSKNVIKVLSPCILRVLWEVAAGVRLGPEDSRLLRLIELLNLRNRAFDMAGGVLSQVPWIRHVAPEWSGYRLLTSLNEEMRTFLLDAVHHHKSSYAPNITRDLIDAFLHEMNANPESETFTERQLVVVLLDLFLGGATSTSTTLDFAFLLMLKFPEVQERVFQEIQRHVGSERLPTIADRVRLPYSDAVLLEVQRFCSVIPVNGPRRALNDTTLGGYHIPKGTTVLMSQWAVHTDKEVFPDPFKFNPDRFLDESARDLRQENVFSFGSGKRRCLGENLAKPCLFLIFVGILQTFRLQIPEGDPQPDLRPIPGIILTPKPYSAVFVRR